MGRQDLRRGATSGVVWGHCGAASAEEWTARVTERVRVIFSYSRVSDAKNKMLQN